MPVARPATVTIVAVLAYLSGVLDIVDGTVTLFTRDQVSRGSGAEATAWLVTSAIISIILGVVILAVAHGLLAGSRSSRALVTVIMAIGLINGLLLVFTEQFVNGILDILWAVIILSMLYTARANAFFQAAG